jgi:hypothetical protein
MYPKKPRLIFQEMAQIWHQSVMVIAIKKFKNFQVTDIIKNMCWVFPEILIISMSLGIVTRFDQLTNRLEIYNGTVLSQNFWHEIYSHYVLLCDMVNKADQILSPMVLIYSFSNLFFICEKIFRLFE